MNHQVIWKVLFLCSSLLSPDLSAREHLLEGEQTYRKVCATCHEKGVANAPRVGHVDHWKPLIGEGQVKLTAHGFVGVRGMPPRGGSAQLPLKSFASALVYMVNQSGGHWQSPDDVTLNLIEQEIKVRRTALKAP